ncbi:MAG: proliferating cell nuclear antigen (pcna) [Candidatus Micrarchaeia archaeon]
MELLIEDAKFFKQCVDAIDNLVDEGTFEVSASGLRLRTMDPSQIALVDFFLPKEAFKKFDFDGTAMLGINLADLSKVLGRARSGESLKIASDEKESNKLFLEFRGESKRDFKLPLLDLSASMAKELKIPFSAHVKIKGGAFKELLKDASLLSSHVVLEASADEFILEAHGDSGDLKTETKKDAPSMVELKYAAAADAKGVAAKSARAMFPYEYLDNITRACPDDAALEIALKSDAPVKASYQIGKAQLSYFLAPRVESI